MGKLIRLELYNFKSYKGHHVLLFGDAYFTSIIGPNGSGKSNSMDAISFVLGIKSSHLRSSHLRDLVYRGRVLRHSTINDDGSASRPGANGHVNGDDPEDNDESQDTHRERHDPKSAWVMAVYEDDAGDEQQWKRSITNQGVSEYRINNRVVTAQQYNEALEAENILMKARNFLVFQGDVEAIASQSPKDLTRLIEQISGSLDYKAEYERLKAAAEESAEQQTFQLNRRRGMNSEIKQYQEQKREAENYARKAEERDQAAITHILWKLYHFQRQIDESSAEIQRHQEELKEHRRGVEKYERDLEEARKNHTRVGRDVGKAERAIKAKEKEIEEKLNSLVPVDEKAEVTTQKLRNYAGRIAEIMKEQTAQANAVQRHEKDLKTVEKAHAQWEAEWKKTMEKKGTQLSEADFLEYKQLKEQVNKQSSANQIRLDNLKHQRKAEEETVNSLKSKVDGYEWQLKSLENDTGSIKERKANASRAVKETMKEIETKKKELNSMTSERLRASQNRTETEEKLQEVLKKLIEADDGRKQSEREIRTREMISTLKRIFPGVKGRVGDLCKPKQKKYAEAVSTVLGRHFDEVVVDTEKTARECIQYLRDQRSGQATFVPLATIQTKPVPANMRGMHPKMRPAYDVVDFDDSMSKAISYACGNSMVCDDLATARYLCYERHVDAKAVTLDGTVIHKAGLMTGGRGPGQQNARRWEDADITALRKMEEKLRRDLEALPKDRRSTEEETLEGQLAGLEQRLTLAREELKSLDRNLESKTKECDFVKRQLSESQPKYHEKARSLQDLDDNIQEFKEAVSSVEDRVFRAFCQRLGYDDIRDYEARQGSLQQEAAQKKLEFTKQRGRIENMLGFERQRLEQTEDRVKALHASEKRDRSLISELESERESIQSEVDTLNAELDELQDELDEQKSLHEKAAETLAEQRREVQKRSKNIDSTLKIIAGLEGEVHQSSSGRYALLRKCKLEDIAIPIAEGSRGLEQLPINDIVGTNVDEDVMDVDEDPTSSALQMPTVQDYGIEVAFDGLDDDLKEDDSENLESELQDKIKSLTSELEKMAPNMRAVDRLEGVESKLRSTEKEFEDARKQAKKAKEDFEAVMKRRSELFNKAYNHIADQVDPIYKELTKASDSNIAFKSMGQAYLDIESSEEPYLEGIKYHAMPPLKRFRDMEHLSGGEKTMAALALLFAIHSYQPSPFFVLDEVDAALDNTNVARIAGYIKEHAGPGMQFVVISLKTGLFQNSEALVGIMRDQGANSSRALTLDLRKYR